MSYEEEDTYLGTDQVHILVRRGGGYMYVI
jgi:hypothetical protein